MSVAALLVGVALSTAQPVLFGADESILDGLVSAPPVQAAAPARGWLWRAEGRLAGHSNPSEAMGGEAALVGLEAASVTGWWLPRPGGPRLYLTAEQRAREFLGPYQPESLSVVSASAVQAVYGPLYAYGGGAGLLYYAGAPRPLVDLDAGLALDWPLSPTLGTTVGYQLDRVNDTPEASFWGHAAHLNATWRPGWQLVGTADYLGQLRLMGTQGMGVRHRVAVVLERPWRPGLVGGLVAEALVDQAGSDQPIVAVSFGPRLRVGY